MTPYADFASASELREHAKRVHRAMWGKPTQPVVVLRRRPPPKETAPPPSAKGYRMPKVKVDDIQLAHIILARFSGEKRKTFSLISIVDVCAKLARVTVDELRSLSKESHVLPPRFVAYYLAREYTSASFPEIGQIMRRDSSSVHHGYERCCEELRDGNEFYASMVAEALRELEAA